MVRGGGKGEPGARCSGGGGSAAPGPAFGDQTQDVERADAEHGGVYH